MKCWIIAEEFSAVIIMKVTVAGFGLFGHVVSTIKEALKLIQFVFHIFLALFPQ
jgi:hypothetical protein